MAGEITFGSSQYSGDTLYFRLFDETGDIWSTVSGAFVTLASADVGDYDISLTETASTGEYKGNMPGAGAGVYPFVVCQQAGGSPAWSDDRIGEGIIQWDGSSEIPLNTILADTNEMQGDLADGGRLDNLIDGIKANTDDLADGSRIDLLIDAIKAKTDNLPADPADDSDIDSQLSTIDTVVDAIKTVTDNLPNSGLLSDLATILVDTNELQTDWVDGGRLDLIIDELTTQGDTNETKLDTIDGVADDILVDTTEIGAAGAGLTSVPWNASWDAEVQSEVEDALDETIADSIPADGSRPSIRQALLMITRFLMERDAAAGTTVTVYKEDGSTSSMTFTLDSAANPTSITRSG